MNLDLRQFKKIKDDQHSAILQHPAGHKIEISKGSLNPKHAKDLSKLPLHFDVGGPVPGDGSEAKPLDIRPPEIQDSIADAPVMFRNVAQNPDADPAARVEALQKIADWRKGQADYAAAQESKLFEEQQKKSEAAAQFNQMAPQYGLPSVGVQNPTAQSSLPSTQSSAAPAEDVPSTNISGESTVTAAPAQQDPFGMGAYGKGIEGGIAQKQAGITGEAQALGELGKQQAVIQGESQINLQEAAKKAEANAAEYEANDKKLVDMYQNQHIDQNRFMNSMGTGQRIATSIGLILGGMGAGITGGPNPALEFLNKQIDNDIKSQETELNKTNNLLSYNMSRFKNKNDAINMTKATNLEIAASKLNQATAAAQDPLAKARGQAAVGQLQMDAATLRRQVAMNQAMMGMMNNQTSGGASSGNNPSYMIRMLVPEGQQQAAFKELEEAQGSIKAKDNLLSTFDHVNKINTVANRLTSPIQTAKQVDALVKPIVAQLSKATAGRFTEADAGYIATLFPAVGDSAETVQTKRNQLNKIISEKMNFPTLSAYGINLGNQTHGSRYAESGERKIQLGPPVAPVAKKGK